MSLAGDDPEHVVIVPGCHFTPTASAGSATAVSANKVEGDFAQEGEIAGGGAVAHAAVVLAAGDVERPMQRVLDAPVPADGLDQDGGIMNLAWIAGLALLVLAGKSLPQDRQVSLGTGVVFVARDHLNHSRLRPGPGSAEEH